ncbi:axoneme-associated mst101(2)-like isoform X2 [Olea europaea subsp. europaea]|uniref:Axoneme-associated mst101(2)-like isoform X2 n=1 Tax=Olea europaea subsp. europaea TaxID=158383 RepID=A0A8S0TW23_OLEEU|nr:axoneme-associated mst101(2)-like isoform X2 [Olea europaea subsp. europaea]
MDSMNFKTARAVTPEKGSRFSGISKNSENMNPNVSSPCLKLSNSPLVKSAKSTKKAVSENPNNGPSPKNKIRARKFLIAKKKSQKEESNGLAAAVTCTKCEKTNGRSKCLCVAYDSLRASQEEFFKNRGKIDGGVDFKKLKECDSRVDGEENEINSMNQNTEFAHGSECDFLEIDRENEDDLNANVVNGEMGMKRRRAKLLEEARKSVPDPGAGRVMHLVKAFEKLLTIPKSSDSEEKEEQELEDNKKGIKWALPGLQKLPEVSETQVSSSSFCPSDFFLTSESLGLDSRRASSLNSSQGSISSSIGGRRSRRNSTESSRTFARRKWKRRKPKATSLKPFKLLTEERGKCKEEEFMKRVQQMLEEEEKLRIPIAQGLPWTTDEPECLIKLPVKDITRPVDLLLHSDIRAEERAGFDHQVAEKLSLIEQYRMERERQRKIAEEEEIRRLRKELVPKAQPMPYFDRPFIPRRSMKQPTIPKEPKFHIPQHKKIKCAGMTCVHNCNEA